MLLLLVLQAVLQQSMLDQIASVKAKLRQAEVESMQEGDDVCSSPTIKAGFNRHPGTMAAVRHSLQTGVVHSSAEANRAFRSSPNDLCEPDKQKAAQARSTSAQPYRGHHLLSPGWKAASPSRSAGAAGLMHKGGHEPKWTGRHSVASLLDSGSSKPARAEMTGAGRHGRTRSSVLDTYSMNAAVSSVQLQDELQGRSASIGVDSSPAALLQAAWTDVLTAEISVRISPKRERSCKAAGKHNAPARQTESSDHSYTSDASHAQQRSKANPSCKTHDDQDDITPESSMESVSQQQPARQPKHSQYAQPRPPTATKQLANKRNAGRPVASASYDGGLGGLTDPYSPSLLSQSKGRHTAHPQQHTAPQQQQQQAAASGSAKSNSTQAKTGTRASALPGSSVPMKSLHLQTSPAANDDLHGSQPSTPTLRVTTSSHGFDSGRSSTAPVQSLSRNSSGNDHSRAVQPLNHAMPDASHHLTDPYSLPVSAEGSFGSLAADLDLATNHMPRVGSQGGSDRTAGAVGSSMQSSQHQKQNGILQQQQPTAGANRSSQPVIGQSTGSWSHSNGLQQQQIPRQQVNQMLASARETLKHLKSGKFSLAAADPGNESSRRTTADRPDHADLAGSSTRHTTQSITDEETNPRQAPIVIPQRQAGGNPSYSNPSQSIDVGPASSTTTSFARSSFQAPAGGSSMRTTTSSVGLQRSTAPSRQQSTAVRQSQSSSRMQPSVAAAGADDDDDIGLLSHDIGLLSPPSTGHVSRARSLNASGTIPMRDFDIDDAMGYATGCHQDAKAGQAGKALSSSQGRLLIKPGAVVVTP